MTKMVRVIGCVSNETRQHLIFRSMIRVLTQGSSSNLKHQWSFSEVGPYDVTILDMDDAPGSQPLSPSVANIIVAFSTHPQRLGDQPFVLSKPIRGNEFLQLLQAIEAISCDSASAPVAAPAASVSPSTKSSAPTAPAVVTTPEPLVRLLAWPDLPMMPGDCLHDAARICALLAVRPCPPSTISSFLDIAPANVDRILQQIPACSATPGELVLDIQHHATATADNVVPLHDQGQVGKSSSLLSKIWNRLRGAA